MHQLRNQDFHFTKLTWAFVLKVLKHTTKEVNKTMDFEIWEPLSTRDNQVDHNIYVCQNGWSRIEVQPYDKMLSIKHVETAIVIPLLREMKGEEVSILQWT